jgi:predicted RNase H-like nuclease (RuvC/YqgF family)
MGKTMPEDLVVDLPDTGDSVEVEIEPLEAAPGEEAMEAPEEEHLEYSKKVKRRIDKLTKKAREMERQQTAAVDYARGMQAENNELKSRVRDLDKGYVAEYGDRVATQSESLTRDLETAIATNDTSTQVELNKKLAQLASEEERVKNAQHFLPIHHVVKKEVMFCFFDLIPNVEIDLQSRLRFFWLFYPSSM